MFVVGDVIVSKGPSKSYDDYGSPAGEICSDDKWHLFAFEPEAVFLIVNVERDDPDEFQIDIVALTNGMRFKYRGTPDMFVRHCIFL